jgi:hypothetical protein
MRHFHSLYPLGDIKWEKLNFCHNRSLGMASGMRWDKENVYLVTLEVKCIFLQGLTQYHLHEYFKSVVLRFGSDRESSHFSLTDSAFLTFFLVGDRPFLHVEE